MQEVADSSVESSDTHTPLRMAAETIKNTAQSAEEKHQEQLSIKSMQENSLEAAQEGVKGGSRASTVADDAATRDSSELQGALPMEPPQDSGAADGTVKRTAESSALSESPTHTKQQAS